MTMRHAVVRELTQQGAWALSSSGGFWIGVALWLAGSSGFAPLMARRRGGAGAILRFDQVRPARRDAFQLRRAHEITPEFLDRAIAEMKRWKLEFVSIDEACRRAVLPRGP